MTTALFVFAHQDDEIAMASRITYEIARGSRVICACLTDGGSRVSAATRDAETVLVLSRLGVPSKDIALIGSRQRIPDGALVEHLDQAMHALEQWIAATPMDVVYGLAWEGGHQDHDAAALVAAALAHRRGIECWEMPLYHGRTAFRVFRVLAPLGEGWIRRRITAAEGMRIVLLTRLYRSQRKSWLGLVPEAFLKLVVLRREVVRRVEPGRFYQSPHQGSLLYETRFRFPRSRFQQAARPFIERYWPRPSDSTKEASKSM